MEREPDFRLDGFAEAEAPSGEVIRVESPGLAVWTAHPNSTDGLALFDWYEGRIVVKNPDDAILARMRDVARALDARVQGDDGEFYDEGAAAPDSPPEKPSGFFGRLFGRR